MQTALLSDGAPLTQGVILDGLAWPGDLGLLGVVLSNPCDFEHNHLSFISIAAVIDARLVFQTSNDYKQIVGGNSYGSLGKGKKETLGRRAAQLVYNKDIERYFFVDARSIEQDLLVVDFQNLLVIPYSVGDKVGESIGILNSPYREKMLTHFASYTSRVGVDRPNDLESIIEMLVDPLEELFDDSAVGTEPQSHDQG